MRSIRENAEKILEENMNYANGQIKVKFIGKDSRSIRIIYSSYLYRT